MLGHIISVSRSGLGKQTSVVVTLTRTIRITIKIIIQIMTKGIIKQYRESVDVMDNRGQIYSRRLDSFMTGLGKRIKIAQYHWSWN